MADGDRALELDSKPAGNLNGVSGPGVRRFDAVPMPAPSNGNGLLAEGLTRRTREEELEAQRVAGLPNYRPVGLEENRASISGMEKRRFRKEEEVGQVETQILRPPWMNAVSSVMQFIGAGFHVLGSGIQAVGKFTHLPILEGLGRVVPAVWDMCAVVVPKAWSIGAAVVGFLANPKTWELFGAGLKIAGAVSWTFLKALSRLDLVTAGKMLWSLGKWSVGGLSNCIGLTDILESAWCLVNGDLSGAKDHFLKGGAKFLEATGVKDTYLFVKCLWEGDGVGAGEHLFNAALSIGAIWASIATLGAASHTIWLATLGRQAAKDAAVQVFKLLGRATGELLVGEINSKAKVRIATELTPRIVDKGAAILARDVERHGAQILDITLREGKHTGRIRDVYSKVACDEVKRFLEELKIHKLTKSEVHKWLLQCNNTKEKDLAKFLMESFGIQDKKLARQLANRTQHVLKSRSNDKLLAKALEDVMTEDVAKYLRREMKGTFEARLKAIFKGEMDTVESRVLSEATHANAARLGREVDSLVDDYVRAGWEGAEEGIEAGARAVIRRGIKDAFKEFRKQKKPKLFKLHKGGHGHAGHIDDSLEEATEEARRRMQDRVERALREGHFKELRHRDVFGVNGERWVVEEGRVGSDRWEEICREIIDIGRKAA